MPPVPEPKNSAPMLLPPVPENAADAQGDIALPGMSSMTTAAKKWLPAVGAAATDAGAEHVIADAVRDLVNDGTVQAIESTVFNVVQAIADAVQDGTESEADDQDDNEDKSPQRKKKIARKRERTPEETQPMSPEANATPSTPDPDESQKVDDDGADRKIMSPCKKPKQDNMVPDLVQM